MSKTTTKKEGMLTMKRFQTMIAATLAVSILAAAAVQPAKADGAASTRTIILGAAALVAGIAIESNAAHKHAVANTIQGYLPDGSVVYEDGHVVLPNGQTYYPGNYGQTVACSNQACSISAGNGNTPYYGNAPYNGSTPYYGNAPNYGNNAPNPYYGYAGNTQNNGNAQCNQNATYSNNAAYGNNRYAYTRYRGR
jgi:hypothetical protein